MRRGELRNQSTMMVLLDQYSGPIAIVSGEGVGPGHAETYTGARTQRAIRTRLTRERCVGDRWARAVIYHGVNSAGEPIGIDLESDEEQGWPPDLPQGVGGARPGSGRPVGSSQSPHGRGKRVQVYLPERLLSEFDAAAQRAGQSRSSALVEAIERYLAQ